MLSLGPTLPFTNPHGEQRPKQALSLCGLSWCPTGLVKYTPPASRFLSHRSGSPEEGGGQLVHPFPLPAPCKAEPSPGLSQPPSAMPLSRPLPALPHYASAVPPHHRHPGPGLLPGLCLSQKSGLLGGPVAGCCCCCRCHCHCHLHHHCHHHCRCHCHRHHCCCRPSSCHLEEQGLDVEIPDLTSSSPAQHFSHRRAGPQGSHPHPCPVLPLF